MFRPVAARLPRLLRSLAMTNLRVLPSCVIPRSEAPLALPLGELSPKVTERALQALPISTGPCSNDTHLRLVIPRSEATWESREGSYVFAGAFLLPIPLLRDCHVASLLAMTNLKAGAFRFPLSAYRPPYNPIPEKHRPVGVIPSGGAAIYFAE